MPEKIRTADIEFRKLALYPTELRIHTKVQYHKVKSTSNPYPTTQLTCIVVTETFTFPSKTVKYIAYLSFFMLEILMARADELRKIKDYFESVAPIYSNYSKKGFGKWLRLREEIIIKQSLISSFS